MKFPKSPVLYRTFVVLAIPFLAFQSLLSVGGDTGLEADPTWAELSKQGLDADEDWVRNALNQIMTMSDGEENRIARVHHFLMEYEHLLAKCHVESPRCEEDSEEVSRNEACGPSDGGEIREADFLETETQIAETLAQARRLANPEARIAWMEKFLALNEDLMLEHEARRASFFYAAENGADESARTSSNDRNSDGNPSLSDEEAVFWENENELRQGLDAINCANENPEDRIARIECFLSANADTLEAHEKDRRFLAARLWHQEISASGARSDATFPDQKTATNPKQP